MNDQRPQDHPGGLDDAAFSFWWKFVHNAIIHPLLAFPWSGPRLVERAHDWTAERCRGAG